MNGKAEKDILTEICREGALRHTDGRAPHSIECALQLTISSLEEGGFPKLEYNVGHEETKTGGA